LAHSIELTLLKTLDSWLLILNKLSKLIDRFLTPFASFETIANVLTNVPVERDQFLVSGSNDLSEIWGVL
jgi:hypothetical protein